MKKKKLYIILFICIIILGISIFLFYKFNNKKNKPVNDYPIINLDGKNIMDIDLPQDFVEPGYSAYDETDGDITNKVTVKNGIDYSTPGTYEILYNVTNSKGNSVEAKRFITIKKTNKIEYKESYDKIDNAVHGWGTNNKRNGKRPNTDMSNEELKKYNAYAMGNDEKIIYLTFDEGNLESYLPEIVNILNQNDVKATFFLCRGFIKNNPELMKEMVEKGHSIGNHTANHISMPTLANSSNFEKYLKELSLTEETFKAITGEPMDRIYREPRGEYSLRSLSIIKDLGYRTYFWSAAYQDWDDKLTKEQALQEMISHVHNGAIYLLHPNSKGNYLALDDFIKQMKEQGYTFDLVKNIE
ncbi:MAG: polysaccharide deacetylase family protein [Bacilli bacterium]|nr:polysaccharide deacetylase family protein [Bacilli bacterium]